VNSKVLIQITRAMHNDNDSAEPITNLLISPI